MRVLKTMDASTVFLRGKVEDDEESSRTRLSLGRMYRQRMTNWQESQFAQRSCPQSEPQGCGE